MLTVLRVHLPSEIPIVGCEITPYVLLRRPDGSVTTDDVPDDAPVEGHYLRHRWYRIQSERKVAICSIHPTEKATLQCIGCIKSKIPAAKSYHCTSQCFSDSWQHHRLLHEHANSASKENGTDEDEISGRIVANSTPSNVAQSPGLSNGSIPFYPSNNVERNGGETSYEVGRSKVYTPTAEDIGHVLKLECIATDVETRIPVGACNTILTSLVIPAPTPFPRRLIPVGATDVKTHSDSDGRITSLGSGSIYWKKPIIFKIRKKMEGRVLGFTALVAFALILSLDQVVGIRFVIDREECFSHSVPYEGDTVRVSFVVVKGDSSWHFEDDGVDLVVKGPSGEQIHDSRDKTSEKFDFIVREKGVHKFCFTNKSPYHETIDFDVHVAHFAYYEEHAKDEHFAPLFEQITKLEEALYNIQFEQHWLEAQTHRQSLVNEGLGRRSIHKALFESAALIGVSILQVYLLRRLF